MKLPIDTPPICLVCGWGGGAGTSAEPEASFDHETPKETYAPSSLVAHPEGVPVSVRSSSDWEAVTTSDAWGRSAWGQVLGVTLIIRANDHVGDGATDFDHPHA